MRLYGCILGVYGYVCVCIARKYTVYLCICVYICNVYVNVCTCVYVRMCMYCLYVRMYVCVCIACMCVCVYIYIYIYICECVVCVCLMYICMCMCVYCVHVCTCVYRRADLSIPPMMAAIQRRGCLLIRLLFDEACLRSSSQSFTIASTIVNILLRWRTEPRAQAEVGVAHWVEGGIYFSSRNVLGTSEHWCCDVCW